LSVTGAFNQGPAGILDVVLGGSPGSGSFGTLSDAEQAGLAGTLRVDLADGYVPALGDSFDILDLMDGEAGTFSTLSLPALSPGLSWDSSDLYAAGVISVVPEPVSAFTIALIGAGFLARRRPMPSKSDQVMSPKTPCGDVNDTRSLET
jgi:hypothetical protein